MREYLQIVFFLFIPFISNAGDLKLIDQWKHQEVLGCEYYSVIDKDNHVVAGFRFKGNRVISAQKSIKFAPRGKGPNDLTGADAAFPFKGDLAIVERSDKIKIFEKKNGTYLWKETKWLKRGKWIHRIKDAIYLDDKFFIAGQYGINMTESKQEYGYLKIYSSEGQPLKQLIREEYTRPHQFHLMRYYVCNYKDHVFLMKANELTVYSVSLKELELEKKIDLEVPSFYKKMPESFYVFKKYDNPKDNFRRDMEEWEMGYSSIQAVIVWNDRLVVQLRTANPEMKNFAILFYNAKTFKLEQKVFLDDFLLGIKDGKFYCFANGNPGLDEETDDCNINIYSFEDKK